MPSLLRIPWIHWGLTPAEPVCQCRRFGFDPRVRRYTGGGNGNPCQYSCWKILWTEDSGGLLYMGSQRVRHAKELSTHTWSFLALALPLEKALATHSSALAWTNPWTEEPGRLQSMGSLRVGHDWATWLSLFTVMHWRRKWQPTPVFLPGESQGRGSLVGCRLWGRTELDTTEAT